MFKGERVLLRPVKKEDIPRQHEFYQDVDIHLLNAGLPHVFPIERAEEMYELCTKKDKYADFFAIEADEKYIGFCSLRHSEIYPGSHVLGITIGDRDYWGQGYGKEVVNLLLHYGFHYLGARRIGLGTNARNERAIKCFQACGFVDEGGPRKMQWIDGDYVDIVYMGILREEWGIIHGDEQNTGEIRKS
ncbi:MAG: GNAT family N-acetyltransferase [Candidatus Aegiribacteria sp.]|nr:GNAT family N-acetyltransferase [Candidatus Aegiribacteria sp.]